MLSDRKASADAAFAAYDMGEMVVKDTGRWQVMGDDWAMPVFIEGTGNEPSTRMVFVVRFESGSALVTEAYFAG